MPRRGRVCDFSLFLGSVTPTTSMKRYLPPSKKVTKGIFFPHQILRTKVSLQSQFQSPFLLFLQLQELGQLSQVCYTHAGAGYELGSHKQSEIMLLWIPMLFLLLSQAASPWIRLSSCRAWPWPNRGAELVELNDQGDVPILVRGAQCPGFKHRPGSSCMTNNKWVYLSSVHCIN